MTYSNLRKLAISLREVKWYKNYCKLYDKDFMTAIQSLTIHKFDVLKDCVEWYQGKSSPKIKRVEAFVFRNPTIATCKVCGSTVSRFIPGQNKFSD